MSIIAAVTDPERAPAPADSDAARHLTRRRSRARRRMLGIAGGIVLALSLSACGLETRKAHPTAANSNNSAMYIDAGPLTYQVEVSRALNPFSTEDAQYLAGVPGAQAIPADQLWFAVFLWAKNQTNRTLTTSDQFTIVDSSGTVYRPWPLNPQVNPYAWTSQQLQPDGTEPGPDTTAGYGPIEGGLVLFRLSQSVYSNRPLTLQIFVPGQAKPSTVSLDL